MQGVLCQKRACHGSRCFYRNSVPNLLDLFPLVFAGENVIRWEAHAGRELVWLEHTQKDVHLSNGLLRPSIHQPAAVIIEDSLYGPFDRDVVHPGYPRLDQRQLASVGSRNGGSGPVQRMAAPIAPLMGGMNQKWLY